MRKALMLVYGAASSFSMTMLFKPVSILTLSGDTITLTRATKTYTRLEIPMNVIAMTRNLKRALLNSKEILFRKTYDKTNDTATEMAPSIILVRISSENLRNANQNNSAKKTIVSGFLTEIPDNI